MRLKIGATAFACLLLGLALGAASCQEFPIQFINGSGKVDTRTFDLAGFDRVQVNNAFQVEIAKASTFSVKVEADDNLFQHMDITASGGTLSVRLKPGVAFVRATQKVSVSMPDLKAISVGGASRCSVSGFASPDAFEVSASGASNLEITDVKAGATDIVVSGASRVTGDIQMAAGSLAVSGASTLELEGQGADIRLNVSGASNGRLEDFKAASIGANISGASNAAVTLSGKLDAEVSGASRLTYAGGTLGIVNVTGASTLSARQLP
jgi:hypothetical protein